MTSNVKVTIGTPGNNGYDWSYVTKSMTEAEYHETRNNLRGSMCYVEGPQEREYEAKRLARKRRNK